MVYLSKDCGQSRNGVPLHTHKNKLKLAHFPVARNSKDQQGVDLDVDALAMSIVCVGVRCCFDIGESEGSPMVCRKGALFWKQSPLTCGVHEQC